jgi:hypothetical protein
VFAKVFQSSNIIPVCLIDQHPGAKFLSREIKKRQKGERKFAFLNMADDEIDKLMFTFLTTLLVFFVFRNMLLLPKN